MGGRLARRRRKERDGDKKEAHVAQKGTLLFPRAQDVRTMAPTAITTADVGPSTDLDAQ